MSKWIARHAGKVNRRLGPHGVIIGWVVGTNRLIIRAGGRRIEVPLP